MIRREWVPFVLGSFWVLYWYPGSPALSRLGCHEEDVAIGGASRMALASSPRSARLGVWLMPTQEPTVS